MPKSFAFEIKSFLIFGTSWRGVWRQASQSDDQFLGKELDSRLIESVMFHSGKSTHLSLYLRHYQHRASTLF